MNRLTGSIAIMICSIAWLVLLVGSGFSVLAVDVGLLGGLGVIGATQAHAHDGRHSHR